MKPCPVRTVKAVDRDTLLALDGEARARRFNRRHGVEWLADNTDPAAVCYLYSAFSHRTGRHHAPQWRCLTRLTMRDGRRVLGLLDVWPPSFARLPDTVDPDTRREVIHELLRGDIVAQSQWTPHDSR